MSLERIITYCREFIFDGAGRRPDNLCGSSPFQPVNPYPEPVPISRPDEISYVHYKGDPIVRALAFHLGHLVQFEHYPVDRPVLCPFTGQPKLNHQIYYLPAGFRFTKELIYTVRYLDNSHVSPPPDISVALESLHERPPELPPLITSDTFISIPSALPSGFIPDAMDVVHARTRMVEGVEYGHARRVGIHDMNRPRRVTQEDFRNMLDMIRDSAFAEGRSGRASIEHLHNAAMNARRMTRAAQQRGEVTISREATELRIECINEAERLGESLVLNPNIDLNEIPNYQYKDKTTIDPDDDLLERIDNLLEDDSLDTELADGAIPKAMPKR